MDQILHYLKTTYHPLAIVQYGSFACGVNDEFSDYDCMVIVPGKEKSHDDAVINGLQLDCFIFTPEEVQAEDIDPFLTVYDGNILSDTDHIAADLKARVQEYVREHSATSDEDKQFIISWMRKTMRRVQKNDDEGSYRLIAMLWESLPDYFALRDMFYFGSKKAVAWLKENDPAGYALYHEAITARTQAAILAWCEAVIPS